MAEDTWTHDKLTTELQSIRRAMTDAGATSKAEFGKFDDAVQEVKKGLQEMRLDLEQRERAASQPSGTDREIERAYVARAGDFDSADVVTKGQAISYEGGQLYGHKDHGVVRMLGGTDDIGTFEWGLLDDPNPKTEWQARLQEITETRSLARLFVRRGGTPKLDRGLMRHLRRGPDGISKVFEDNAGEGGEYIADVVVPNLLRTLEMRRLLERNFRTTNLPTGGTTKNPFQTTGIQAYVLGKVTSGDLDPANIPQSVPSTTERTADPITLGVTLPASRDASEDSIIEWAGYARMLLVEALVDASEDAILNGDTAATHFHTGLSGWTAGGRWTAGHAKDHRKAWIGLLAAADDKSASSSGAGDETVSGAMKLRLNLTVAHAFDDLMYITSAEHLLAKWLTDSNLLTMDKVGPNATILTGQVGQVGGYPLVISEFMSAELNASGVYDDATKTKTGVVVVNRNRWEMARRRTARIEFEVEPKAHMTYATVTERKVFREHDGSSVKNVYHSFNRSIS